jgi:LPS-assembly protein
VSALKKVFLAFFVAGWVWVGPGVRAEDTPREPVVLLRYDKARADQDRQVITLEGQACAAWTGRQIRAALLRYHGMDDVLWAEGDVRLHDGEGNEMSGTVALLTDHWSRGWILAPGARMADQARIAGRQAWKLDETRYVLDKGVWSPCALCGPRKVPFWQLKASRILDDRGTHDLSYRHVRLEFGEKIPVFYLPWLSHPGPGVRRRSGFLVPSFLFSSQNGMGIQTPWYYTFSPQRDLTLTPIGTQKGGQLLGWEYRHRVLHGEWSLAGSLMSTHKDPGTAPSLDKGVRIRSFRGHLKGKMRYELNDRWVASSEALLVSDQTYLRRYPYFGHTDAAFLTSTAALEHFDRTTYGAIRGHMFEPLAQDTSFLGTARILPSVEFDTFGEPRGAWTPRWGLHVLNLNRQAGNQMERVSVFHDWTGHGVLSSGIVVQPFLQSRVDGYHTSLRAHKGQVLPQGSQYPFYGSRWRALPSFGVQVRYPLVQGVEGSRVCEPFVMLAGTPVWGTMGSSMPNEDSPELNANLAPLHLARIHPFSGLDHVQKGVRAHYGTRWTEWLGSGAAVTAEIGRITPLVRESFLANGLNQPVVLPFDLWTGALGYRQNRHRIFTRFQADVRSAKLRQAETGWTWAPQAGWQVLVRQGFGQKLTRPVVRDRFSSTLVTVAFPLYAEGWSGGVTAVTNTDRCWKPLTRTAHVTYTNDCFVSRLSVQRNFYKDREVKADTSFFLVLSFKTLGSFSTQTLDTIQSSLQGTPAP